MVQTRRRGALERLQTQLETKTKGNGESLSPKDIKRIKSEMKTLTSKLRK